MKSAWAVVGLSIGLLGVACSSDPSASGGLGGGGTAGEGSHPDGGRPGAGGLGGSSAAGVNWAEHIAPIVFRECVGCHREGAIGPMALASYSDAAKFAGAMAEEVEARAMPPMPVNNDGSCNTYGNARWLSAEEIELFRAWATAGAPEGDPGRVPALPNAPRGLDDVSVTLDAGADYTPSSARPDDYRCFMVDAQLTENTFLVGYEVRPGDAREVHHAIVYQPASDAAAAEASRLDDAEEGLGYTCFGGARVEAEPRVLWAPGGGVVNLPPGTGLPLVAGRKLILQVHYNLAVGAFPDRTQVRLSTSSSVAKAATYIAAADTKMNIAPGQAEGVTTRTLTGTGKPLRIYGALPHMHTLGLKLHVEAATASEKRCLVDVDRWDFHWQNAWWYASPLTLDQFKSFTISCTYDMRERTSAVTWGEGTSDEMCLSYFYATAP